MVDHQGYTRKVKSESEDPSSMQMMNLLNDAEVLQDQSCDRNRNNIEYLDESMIKEENIVVNTETYSETPSTETQDLLGLHSEIDIKPEPEPEEKPCLSIRKDIFLSSPSVQPNLMSDSPALSNPATVSATTVYPAMVNLAFVMNPSIMNDAVRSSTDSTGSTGSRARYNRGDGVPLYDDPTLPLGWVRRVVQRKTGATAGGWDTYIHSPPSHGSKRFRSKKEIQRYFEKIGEVSLDWRDFDFNPYGSKGQHELIQAMRKTERQEEQEVRPDITSFLSCELKQESL